MANSPDVARNYPGGTSAIAANLAASGNYRVVRIHKKVTEVFVNAATPAAAVAAAQALKPGDWKTRSVYQFEPGLMDQYEYNAVCSDPATTTYGVNKV